MKASIFKYCKSGPFCCRGLVFPRPPPPTHPPTSLLSQPPVSFCPWRRSLSELLWITFVFYSPLSIWGHIRWVAVGIGWTALWWLLFYSDAGDQHSSSCRSANSGLKLLISCFIQRSKPQRVKHRATAAAANCTVKLDQVRRQIHCQIHSHILCLSVGAATDLPVFFQWTWLPAKTVCKRCKGHGAVRIGRIVLFSGRCLVATLGFWSKFTGGGATRWCSR